MTNPNDTILSSTYDFFEKGDPIQAKFALDVVYPNNLENKEIQFAMECANFWIPHMTRLNTLSTTLEKGEYLLTTWKHFSKFIQQKQTYFEKTLHVVNKGIFTQTLGFFQNFLKEPGISQSAGVFFKIGICQKKLGDYETAIAILRDANKKANDSAAILAELADCYALVGQEKMAKVLFREAFFIDAQEIDIELLESELIHCLYNQVKALNIKEKFIMEWIPVYGVIYGVFNIKRDLRAYEVAKLKQSIYALENELKDARSEHKLLTPRLINRYFWLIDYYTITQADKAKIKETLLKIKLLDSEIHEKYTN